MQITSDIFGQHQGQDIERYTIANQAGNFIRVITLGATWQGFVVNGKPLIVNFDSVERYAGPANYCLCKSVGRVAGRISDATATIDGKEFHFDANENGNTLHGGPNGFPELIWNAKTAVHDHEASVIFSRSIPSTEDHFPGDLEATITFTFNDSNEVTVTFNATTTAATLFNPTNHAYFNLTDGQNDITSQQLQINSDRMLELDDRKLPTGKFNEVKNTGCDFKTTTAVTTALKEIKDQTGKVEIDDAFEVTPSDSDPIAVLSDADSNRHVSIYSDRNGLVVFTANPLDDSKPYNAVAMEAQTLPDAINHDGFGDIVLEPSQPKEYTIKYKYYEN
ncbi:aldose epimerase family protein [Paucilactobacillus kaifaensis]|uniref:aldose epimerase family protein n=1 Tax=Paucilactobacillus kaifaensis TaxID=2559921 RepID=UPI0010F89FD0|nr:aldose epimerase family protein [Paucilactobacillus kaifaensis]